METKNDSTQFAGALWSTPSYLRFLLTSSKQIPATASRKVDLESRSRQIGQDSSSAGIPLRQFGRANAKVSILGFGGHHLGDAPDEKAAVRMFRKPSTTELLSTTTAGNTGAARPGSGWGLD
jgi:hypothetical protein